MNSDLIKLKVKSDSVIDLDIQNEIVRLKDRMINSETVLNTRFNTIEISINALLKTILQKLLNILFFYFLHILLYRKQI